MRRYLLILICLPLFGQVPNTTTFSFLDVKNEIENNGGATTNSLVDAFANANASGFDPAYEGSKNSLLNFRNYVHSPFFDTGDSYSFSSQTTAGRGLFFKPDGTKVFIASTTTVYAYTLSTAWDISTITYDGDSFNTDGMSITFKPDGLKMYVGYNASLKEYTLSTAWDITTSSLTYTLSIGDAESNDMGIYLHPSGTYIYKLNSQSDFCRRYTMSTAYDLSTATQSESRQYSELEQPSSIFFKTDGNKFFVTDLNNSPLAFVGYEANSSFSITSPMNKVEVSSATTYRDLYIRDNGQDFYVITQTGLHRWYANTAWEID